MPTQLSPKFAPFGWANIVLRTVAVPLKSYRGDVVASLNICAHASRMSMEQLVDQCLPPLLQAQSHLRMLL